MVRTEDTPQTLYCLIFSGTSLSTITDLRLLEECTFPMHVQGPAPIINCTYLYVYIYICIYIHIYIYIRMHTHDVHDIYIYIYVQM